MRQTKTGTSGKGAKRCSACGAKLWLKDYNTGQFSGPWHFRECPSVPGGSELDMRNLEEREKWQEEKTVPREQGARIPEAISLMISTPKTAEGKPSKVFYERKAAIQEETGKL